MHGLPDSERKHAVNVRASDTYRIICHAGLSSDRLCSFMTLYQPLVGGDGVLVYLTMMAEAYSAKTQAEHRRLFTIMQDIDPDVFERARMRLESYMLVRTYVREGRNVDNYLYVLYMPLGASDFFASSYMSRMYRERVGEKQFSLTKGNLVTNDEPADSYREITAPVRNMVMPDFDNETEYVTVSPSFRFSGNKDINITFDYERFLTITSNAVFPSELRTQETLYQIGLNATTYGITPERMKVILNRCINPREVTFDPVKFDIMCRNEKPSENTEGTDRYAISPVSFLMGLQDGRKLSNTDREVVESLSQDMKFPNEVINVMVEYTLKKCRNRLNPIYIGKMAATWAREGIDTKQKALDAIAENETAEKKERKSSTGRKSSSQVNVSMPQYWSESNETAELSEEQRRILEDMQKEMEK